MTTPVELNKILFDQLNAIRKAKPNDLEHEIDRAEAVTMLAEQVISNNNTMVKYMDTAIKGGAKFESQPITINFLG